MLLLTFADAPLSVFHFVPRVTSFLLTRGYSRCTLSGSWIIAETKFDDVNCL